VRLVFENCESVDVFNPLNVHGHKRTQELKKWGLSTFLLMGK